MMDQHGDTRAELWLNAARQLSEEAERLNARLDRLERTWQSVCLCWKHGWNPRCPRHGARDDG